MPGSPDDRGAPTSRAPSQARARQWSRAAWALAFLFATLPVACRIFVGSWGFDDAFEVSGLCLVLGTYLHILSRKGHPAVPDPATLLDRAMRLRSTGQTEQGILLLSEAIRLSPRLWQAFQYRAELYLGQPGFLDSALRDLNEAIRLAPGEPDLYILRAQAHSLLGDESSARDDYQVASRHRAFPLVDAHCIEEGPESGKPVNGA